MADFDIYKTQVKTLIEERTQARADLFRAQERVRELEAERDKLREENAVVRAEAFRANRRADEFMAELRAIATHMKCGQSVAAVTAKNDAIAKRVEELENDLLAPWGLLVAQRVERLTLGGVDREHDREENRAMDRVRAEAVEIAERRRKP